MKINQEIFSKILLSILLAVFVFGGTLAPRKAQALIPVEDLMNFAANSTGWLRDVSFWIADHAYDIERTITEKVGSISYQSILQNAINKIAYDTATWLGNGKKGKQPMYVSEGWGEYLTNLSDNAVGEVIEQLSTDSYGGNFNICEPNLNVRVLIGLGLVNQVRPADSNCSFTKIIDKWDKEILTNKEFLSNINHYFSSGGDLGVALTLNDLTLQKSMRAYNMGTLNAVITKGYNYVTDPISGKKTATPNAVQIQEQQAYTLMQQGILSKGTDMLVAAGKVFANQYFITLFNRKMLELSQPKTSKSVDPNTLRDKVKSLTNPNAQAGQYSSEEISQNLLELVQPNFQMSSDFNTLSMLTKCSDPENAGTTDCVIDNNFSSAISENLTVGQALQKGYLNQNGKFGFIVEYANNDFHCYDKEPSYVEGYPYRSMLILRKYRILPVGWELAAQYIHDFPQTTHSCTLGDMVACFDGSDEYNYVSDNCKQGVWCRGLVDPNWVLTAPQHVCKRTGPGPTISNYGVAKTSDLNGFLNVKRASYCADEQSCIYEKSDGNCEVYGYCIEEKRKWNFGTDSCDPNFNSCETYKDSTGKSVSYLENTVNNSVCNSGNVGCTDYCEDYSYDATSITRFSLEQDGNIHNFPVAFTGTNTSSAFYNYVSPATRNPLLLNLSKKDKGYLFIYYDTTNEVYSLGIILDTANSIKHLNCESLPGCPSDPNCDCNGGHIRLTFNNISPGNKVTVRDDSGDGLAVGSTITSGSTGNWQWANLPPANADSDGAMVEMPKGDWSVTITPSDYAGISQWALAYNGGEYPLDITKPVTISKNVVTGNFTCLEGTGKKVYLDQNVKTCDADKEGCHQYIRTKSGLGTNLVQNSGFEDATTAETVSLTPTTYGQIVTVSPWPLVNQGASNLNATIFGTTSNRVHSGEKSLLIEADAGSGLFSFDASQPARSRLPVGYNMELNKTYTLSAWVYVEAGEAKIGIGNNTTHFETATTTVSGNWEQLRVSVINNSGLNANEIYIYANQPGTRFYVDDIQLEEGLDLTNYKDYGQANVVYEKILPNYLAAACYNNPGTDYRYKNDHSPICDKFARLCNKDEVGCDMYTSVNTDTSVPAKVDVDDYCTAECVGYDQYMQHATYFSSFLPKYFIPATAKTCDAGSVGCEEFTNLDNVSAGGETKEYYSYLRQCMKPGGVGANCGEFYTWEGSSETGFQLRVHNLQIDDDTDDGGYPNPEAMYLGDPAVTEYDYDSCNELIYKLNLNSDCREFYNRNGEISYHLYSDTISCSADCHNFRMTKNNVVKDPATGADISWPDCQALSKFADNHDIITNAEFTARGGECVFCKNGGTWSSSSGNCLYSAIPSEGTQCSKAVSGCREYSGNNGSSIYNVFTSNFEGSTQGWEGIGATTIITDNDSLRVNEEALRVQVAPFTIAQTVGLGVQRGKSYYLEFIAKSITASQFNAIYLTNGPENANFATDPSLSMTLNGQYKMFKLNLASLDHAISDAESLVIQADGDFMIDDIKLVEITDRYYLLEDSWNTPGTCFQDIYGNPVGQVTNLGCDEYTDRAGATFYLHNFKNMCQESAVGCEALIDTYNSNDFHGATVHAGDASEKVIPADNIVYAVYDNSKSCFDSEKGCQILGKPYDYGKSTVFRPVYLINNPDEYGNTLCMKDEKGCQSWTSREGNVYFKDPGNQTCEYRLESDSSGKKVRNWGWFKTNVKHCDSDANGAVSATDNICLENADCNLTNKTCQADADCGGNNVCISGFCHNACIVDKNDYPCPTTNNVTIGMGGTGARINTPTVDTDYNNWVGICPSSSASCTEYLDPVSDFSVNLLANGNFSSLPSIVYSTAWHCYRNTATVCNSNSDCTAATNDYCLNNVWKGSGANYTQTVKLNHNYLYRLALRNNDAGATLTITCPSITEFDPANNKLGSAVGSLVVSNVKVNQLNSRLFYVPDGGGTMSCTVQASGVNIGGTDYAELKQIIVNYQLETGLDKSSCNGIVNRSEGCILFDERKVTSKNSLNIVYSGLNYDADNTVYGASPVLCSGQSCNSNQIIKVTPDRTCDKWLSCRGYKEVGKAQEAVCTGIGVCDKLDSNGGCERFVASTTDNFTYSQAISGIFTPGDTQNMSGYVKVGYEGTTINKNTTRKSDNKFSFGSMQPYGSQVAINNSSFEATEENVCTPPVATLPNPTVCGDSDYPADTDNKIVASADWGDPDYATNWTCSPAKSDKCETIDDPVENEKEKICFLSDRDSTCKLYAPDGRVYMKLTADNDAIGVLTSASFSVLGSTDYVLSFYVNTLRLSNGRARVRLIEYDKSGSQVGTVQDFINYRLDWRQEEVRFTTAASADSMKIELTMPASELPQGSIYFDKMKILESLWARKGSNDIDTYESKDCRLYPKDDSLSCDYYENNIRYKGWTGYCLEYDRYPGWSNACLQWWSIPSSVDSVNAWCGDNKVGDDEDCECPPIAGKEQYSCVSQIPLSGTSVDNEYNCENCMWTQGWCGDNYVDRTAGHDEECDWNDSTSITPRGSAPKSGSFVYGGATQKITCENLPFVGTTLAGASQITQLSKYSGRMYTDGNLGCYSHDGGTNFGPTNADKCSFDTSYSAGTYTAVDPTSDSVSFGNNYMGFGCTSDLFDDDLSSNTNTVHTAQQCIAAGGVVVSDSVEQSAVPGNMGEVVINSSHATVVGNSDFGNTFCKFTNASGWVGSVSAICATITGGGGGWRAFTTGGVPWTRTPNTCTAHISCSGPPCVHSMSNISTSHNFFANQAIETASVSNSNCDYNGFSCGSSSDSCAVTVTEIGCY